jgi:hypothetical protein
MERVRNFHEKLEADISRLVARSRETKGGSAEKLKGREELKETLETYAAEIAPAPVAPETAPAPSAAAEAPLNVLPNYAAGDAVAPAVKLEVERLIDIVFDKGLDAGIRESKRHLPFVQDLFHDALVDKLLPELEKRGIIG